MYNKDNCPFKISIVVVFILFVYGNQIVFAYPNKGIADCNTINWATWDNFTGNSATGVIKNGTEDINVTMTSNFAFGSTPTIYNHSKFNSYPIAVPNATVPQTTWSKGAGGTTTMCFSRTVTNPVLLIASLGSSAGIQAKLNFSRPYVVVFDGGNMIYHNSTSLTGIEGYAIIMFPGDFDCVTINSTTEEFYTNITWGINPPPFSASISVVDNCDKIQLTASGGVAYQWNGGDTPNSATNTFHTSGSYIVTITNADGCKTSLSKDLVIDNATTISGATTGCGEVTLTASGGVSYQWDGGLNPNSATNTFLQSGKYAVKITSAKGCVSTTLTDVQVTPRASGTNIQIRSTSGETICQNTPVSFIADTENSGSSPIYKWFKNGVLVSSSPTYTSNDLKNNDEIKCELTSSLTCIQQSAKMSNSIIIKIAAPVALSFKSPSILLDGAFVQLDPIIVGDVASYAWSPTDGLDNPFIKNPKASPLNTTTYKLTATSSLGCEYYAEIKVLVTKEIQIPNAFSPNLDGVNDTWEIKNLDSHIGSKLMVYNRNGTMVYQAFNYAGGWDGKHKNKPLPVGVYYYTIALNDKKSTIYTGSVTIIR